MPEGDTIHAAAARLRAALAGRTLLGLSVRMPRPGRIRPEGLVGQRIATVQARGKHLLIWLAPSRTAIHTHLGMSGSWHVHQPGQRWRRPAHLARLVVEAGADEVVEVEAVCFTAPVAELLTEGQVQRHRQLRALGPDAVAPGTDLVEARRRLDERVGWAVKEALLDQRVLAGVGNVYANEVLFIHGVDPWAPVGRVPPATRDALLATAEQLLKANAASGSAVRVTTTPPTARRPGQPTSWVYGRAGRPCRRCGTAIASAAMGDRERVTYWCPACQRTREAPDP